MESKSLRDRCLINSNFEDDTFVGVECINGEVLIHFPIGYRLDAYDDKNEKELRKDILSLIHSIASTVGRKDSTTLGDPKVVNDTTFPFQAYVSVISDYLVRGHYYENEIQYQKSLRGKIDWNRTIKKVKFEVQDDSAYYLNFITKKSSIKDNELISLIYDYCVFESFAKVGWLFTKTLPARPKIKFNKKLFLSVINQKLQNTYNDRNRDLFINMISIINYLGDNDAPLNYRYGTNRYEYVWEALIDKVFGIPGKEKFFPETYWKTSEELFKNSSLEPDTIMFFDGDIYVIDAKYYKYGNTRNPAHLPESTSINKQITYGEYIAESQSLRKEYGDNYRVFNAFLMPFNSAEWNSKDIINVATGYSTWKTNNKEYESIQGILLDVKSLVRHNISRDKMKMRELADSIRCIETDIS